MLPTRALGVLYGMCDLDFQSDLVERFIKFMGPYPVGSFVRLATGNMPSSVRPIRPDAVSSCWWSLTRPDSPFGRG